MTALVASLKTASTRNLSLKCDAPPCDLARWRQLAPSSPHRGAPSFVETNISNPTTLLYFANKGAQKEARPEETALDRLNVVYYFRVGGSKLSATHGSLDFEIGDNLHNFYCKPTLLILEGSSSARTSSTHQPFNRLAVTTITHIAVVSCSVQKSESVPF